MPNNLFSSKFSDQNTKLLSAKDEQSFYESLGNVTNFAFENNWPYILQSTRNCHYKYTSHETSLYITTRRKSCAGDLIVVNAVGRNSVLCIKELRDSFVSKESSILIKNVDERMKIDLSKIGFKETGESWSQYSTRDDNSFPQMVFLLENILRMNGWSHGNKHVVRKYQREPNIHTEFYSPNFEEKGYNLLRDYAKYSFEKGKDFEEEIYRAHTFFFNEDIENKIRLQHLRDGKLIALHFFTKVNDILFWNALININESNIMRILFFEALRFIKDEIGGIKYVMCQGSESEGQHLFKLSFKPIFVIPKTHMIYRKEFAAKE